MKYILILFLLTISLFSEESPFVTSPIVSTKTYHFGTNTFIVNKHKWGCLEENGVESFCEIYCFLNIYKKGQKKPYISFESDMIEIMDTPYKFPYVVFKFTQLGNDGAYTSLKMFDVKKDAKMIQKLKHTNFDLSKMKYYNTNVYNISKSTVLDYFSNPIVLGEDGAYYIQTLVVESNGARCVSEMTSAKVMYRFNGKVFKLLKSP